MSKENHDISKSLGYGYIRQAGSCYEAARMLEMQYSIDEKDKLLDEMLVRRLRKLANDLVMQGINTLNRSYNVSDEEKQELLKEVVAQEINKK